MPLKIVRNDITKMETDAIVNTANPKPQVGDGVDSKIYEAAGFEQLLAERSKIGYIERGDAAATPGFNLPAKYIIHAVGTAWFDGNHRERELLKSAYSRSLELAEELKCKSIAFPLLSSGNYGFPKEEALKIALDAINSFLRTSEMYVYLCVFDRESFGLSKKITDDIDEYIDENYAEEFVCKSRRESVRRFQVREELKVFRQYEAMEDSEPDEHITLAAGALPKSLSLEELISNAGESFNQRLFRLIDERGMDDVTVYKAANLDRKLFSKIRCSDTYIPKKKTILALAAALKLNADEAADLLVSAGMAFSPSSKQDIILQYCLSHGIFDVNSINIILFEYGLPTLDD